MQKEGKQRSGMCPSSLRREIQRKRRKSSDAGRQQETQIYNNKQKQESLAAEECENSFFHPTINFIQSVEM